MHATCNMQRARIFLKKLPFQTNNMQTAVEHSSAENADTKELETSIIEKDDQRTIPLDKSLDPLQWSKKYKWFMVALIECMTLIEYVLCFTLRKKHRSITTPKFC